MITTSAREEEASNLIPIAIRADSTGNVIGKLVHAKTSIVILLHVILDLRAHASVTVSAGLKVEKPDMRRIRRVLGSRMFCCMTFRVASSRLQLGGTGRYNFITSHARKTYCHSR